MAELDAEYAAQMADLTTHRIEGIARMGNTPFNVPIVSQVEGNLWQGGTPAGVGYLPGHFEYVLNLYPWEPYEVPMGAAYRAIKLQDAGEIPDVALLENLASLGEPGRRARPDARALPGGAEPLRPRRGTGSDPARDDPRRRDRVAAREAIASGALQRGLRAVAEVSR